MKTDEDLRAGEYSFVKAWTGLMTDPNFFKDPSGCTAVVTLATSDGRLICVCPLRTS